MRRHRRFLLFACLLVAGCSPAGATTPNPSPVAMTETPSATLEIPPTQPADTPIQTPEPTPKPDLLDPSPPAQTVKLIFIHHSSGENWLADENGGLGLALMENNYFVSDTNYGWGPEDPLLGGPIGDNTDTGHWWSWFLGPSRDVIWDALLTEHEQHAAYTRLAEDPGGPNRIVMFKSCFPNSALGGNPTDPPTQGENPLQGQGSGSEYQTVANAKRIYLDLLPFFAAHPGTLFVAITAPPLLAKDTTPAQAENARAFNRWLVTDWLAGYGKANVGVFDFFNVLTTDGGTPEVSDAGSASGNHHRYRAGLVEYITDGGDGTSAYAWDGDSHPLPAGNRKATAEFVPLLNIFYHGWAATP
jgi:hypothetical protein